MSFKQKLLFTACMQELLRLYAPRSPMAQLADKYRVTEANPSPPLVHFAIPIDVDVLYEYADKHDLTEYILHLPNIISFDTPFVVTEHLSRHVQYELSLRFPFKYTADCGLILALYNNYTMEENMLIDEDQADVIQMVQEALGLHVSLCPKWYFDGYDRWEPDSDEDED